MGTRDHKWRQQLTPASSHSPAGLDWHTSVCHADIIAAASAVIPGRELVGCDGRLLEAKLLSHMAHNGINIQIQWLMTEPENMWQAVSEAMQALHGISHVVVSTSGLLELHSKSHVSSPMVQGCDVFVALSRGIAALEKGEG